MSSPDRFAGKSVFLTGAGSGLGRDAALLLAGEGAQVACVDVVAANAEKTTVEIAENGGTAFAITCDVSDEASVNAAVASAVERFGALDALVNCAGIGGFANTHEETLDHFAKVIDVNLVGTFLTCKAALPHLLARAQEVGDAAIVNTGSIAGLRGQAYSAAYCASKAGVVMMSKGLAVEYATKKIRVNCVCPGGMDTPLLQDFLPFEGANMHLLARNMSPTRRMAAPVEVAQTIVFLASTDASFVSGAALPVDLATIT